MVKKLARMVAILMWVLPGWAYALGLGDIELNSYLNEKLDARIELIGVTPEEMASLRVTLASPADFVRAGMEFHPSLGMLQFAPVTPTGGNPYVRIFTKDSFREPFLNFLIEVNWGKGRIIREYTLLIDPPTLVSAPPVVTEAAVSRSAQQQSGVAESAGAVAAPSDKTGGENGLFPRIPIEAETTPAASKMQTAQAPGGSVQQYTTKRNDTLWGIANKVRPDRTVSVEQAMMGIYRQNPEAFQGNNINRLKAGYVIKVPGREVMTSMTTGEARAESARQYREWKALRTQARRPEEMVAPEPEVTEETLPEGKLEILAPRTEEGQGEGVATGRDAEAPQADAGVMDEAQLPDNAAVRSRVAELESEIQNMQRMAAIRDQELAALQQKLAEMQASKPEPQSQAPRIETEEEIKPREPVAARPAVKPAPAPVKPAPKAEPPRQEDDLLTTVKGYVEENPMMVGVAGGISLLVIVLLLMLVRQRRHAAEGGEFDESILRDRRPATPVIPERDEEATTDVVEEAPVEESEEAAEPEKPKSSYLSDFAVSSMGNLHESSEADPLTEADVFLAYGRFQPAEVMIREAIESEPGRMDLKLKLMEIFYAAKDQDNFEREAQVLHESMGDNIDPIWDKVVDMGKDLCPGCGLFNEGAAASPAMAGAQEFELPDEAPAPEATDDMSLEFEATEFTPATESPAQVVEADKGNNLIDFDLGSFADTEAEMEQSADTTAGLADEDMGLDFDLGSMGSEDELEASAESMEALEEVSQGLDEDDTNEVAEQLASELEDLANSMEGESPATERVEGEEQEEMQEFSFDTVESDASELGDLGEFALDDDLALDEEDAEAADELAMPDSDDEVGTKLDLARAYIDMGDPDGARSILDEVLEEGNEQQKNEARELQGQLS